MHESLADGFITKYADPLCLLGVGFGLVTAYIMFDIDRGSPNHPSNDPRAFERFLHTLARIGLNTPVIIRSSHSGGIHVYYFFDRDINTFRIASLSQVTLLNAKFEIADGTLELFPNCKPHDNKSNHKLHRSPLQPNNGGAILDRQGNPLICGVNLNHETQLHAYLQMAKNSARNNDIDKIEQQLDPVYAIFKSIPSRYQYIHNKGLSEKAKVWKIDLEVFMGIGWTDYHQTNGLIPRFIAYGIVFMGLEDQKDLFEWVLFAIKNTNGYTQYCRHQHNIEARIWDWIKLTADKQFYVKYCGYPPRSSDRDNFIARYKNSKSVPTSRADVYQRARVESVASKIQETVETILATIADIPSRIGDVIQLIQSTARQKFGQAFSRNTLYKPHYKYIWVKLLGIKNIYDMVLTTPVIVTNMEYCSETLTETAFERSAFCATGLPKTNLKPIGGETSHSTPSVCSVNVPFCSPLANEIDLDLDLDLDLKNIPLDLDSDPRFIELPTTPTLFNSDTNPRFPSIEPAQDDLINRLLHDRDKSIEPDPEQKDSYPDPIHSQSAPILPLPNLDSNPQSDSIELSTADLTSRSTYDWDRLIELDPEQKDPIHRAHKKNDRVQLIDIDDREHQSTGVVCAIIGSRAMVKWDVSRKLNTYPIANLKIINPKIPKKLSEAQQIILYAEKSKYLAQLIPYNGCLVSTIDAQQVHGWVIAVRDWDVYVNWQDGSSGRYAIEELICIYSPCANNFIEKLIDRSQVPASEF